MGRSPEVPLGRSASSSLTARRRVEELARAIEGVPVVDLLVIGGGITGVGVALDAATRGLRTVLIEADDLAFGTSRWSSKLIHGGLRYLASGDVAVAYECAVERGYLLRSIAPHLVRSTPMLLPLMPGVTGKKAFQMGLGIVAGDILRRVARTASRELRPPRWLSRAAVLGLAPGLPANDVRGGLVFHDGQVTDDARLVVAVARTAAAHGASILTRVRAKSIGADGVVIVDELTGMGGAIRARAVVNATGVWAAQLAPELALRPSRGTHVVLDGEVLPGLRASLTLPFAGQHNRYLLLLPQLDGRLYLGLTDDDADQIEDVPVPRQREIDELVGALGTLLGHRVAAQHVIGAYTGLRPLLAGSNETTTSDLSRTHGVVRGKNRTVNVVGGKLTTYRRMAQDGVDAAIEHAGLEAGPCRTTTLPLVGAAPRSRLATLGEPALRIGRYGLEATLVAEMERDDPSLAELIAPGVPVTRAELRFSVLHEGALTADDLLDRRFRVGLVAADRSAALPAAEAAIVYGSPEADRG
jgi:glycerol-3-phosphate dehydrogenase